MRDLRAYLPTTWLGPRSVLALRYTEARARGRTEPFQLGGATDDLLQLGPTLNNRTLSLRGYLGDEPALRGASARVATVEWRTPLWDIDRHAMVPAVGNNRLSATVFMDVGGAWNTATALPHGAAAWAWSCWARRSCCMHWACSCAWAWRRGSTRRRTRGPI